MARAYGVKQIMNANFKTLDFDGHWLDLIGQPEPIGSWMIWGGSWNGKSSFCLALAKYLTQFGKVAYNSLEEGRCESIKRGFQKVDMMDVDGKLLLLDQEPISELILRLEKKKSPRFIFIDSLQYAGLTYKDYIDLINRFRNKLFICLSHADGKEPAGAVAKRVRYDAFVKIWVEGFMAFAESRYGGNRQPYTIWQQGAEEYYGEKI